MVKWDIFIEVIILTNYVFISILKYLKGLCIEKYKKQFEDTILEYLTWLHCSEDLFNVDYNKYVNILEKCFIQSHLYNDIEEWENLIYDGINIMYLDMEEMGDF